jgi:Zn-dependent metalloprotease
MFKKPQPIPLLGMLILTSIGIAAPTDSSEIYRSAKSAVDLLAQSRERSLPPDTQIRRDAARGTITFLRAKNLSEDLERDSDFRALQSANRFADIALAFLTAYRSSFHLQTPVDELVVKSVTTDDLGSKHIRLQQTFAGIPVWGAEIIVHLDQYNHVYLAQGSYIPTPSGLRTRPVLGSEEALRIVAEHVDGIGPECRGCQAELVIFVPADNTPHLAYRVLAIVSLTEAWAIMIDAVTGTLREKLPTVYTRTP